MGKGDFLICDEAETLIKTVERYIANKPADYAENIRVDYSFKFAQTTPDLNERRFYSTNISIVRVAESISIYILQERCRG